MWKVGEGERTVKGESVRGQGPRRNVRGGHLIKKMRKREDLEGLKDMGDSVGTEVVTLKGLDSLN